jgi:uncharacterized protein
MFAAFISCRFGGFMQPADVLCFDENTVFKSMRRDFLRFDDVYGEIINFINADSNSSYKISIGTDSQVARHTVYVSCIHVHRIGRGAIGFLHQGMLSRPIINLREKIFLETYASLQLAYMFDDDKISNLCRMVEGNNKSKGITFEFHIDIGTKGQTKTLINEMTGMVKGLSFIPKIKPDSYCASCFADRYTKTI